jgi:hypothetical protein
MVVHTYTSSYLSGRDRRIQVCGQPRQKLVKTYLKNKLGMVACACGPIHSGGRIRRTEVQQSPGIATLSEKQTKNKRS